ncbi:MULTISPECIES: EcsC family protein [unclassified Olleya]|uniref:EcsC family protein n=1 Tax=unclassified Olleya TaxID=2615019 RepID=UPI000C30E823|nr:MULTISPECIES: EcsC family protein [unclassified Olleya]AUC75519.1 peptidase [Olleya sp. Bg11-27]QXP61427.1 EcsC family protein [Olleya sp. HaHaR_3_96]
MNITQQDLQELKDAKALLENPGFAAKITNFIGKPFEKGLEILPEDWKDKLVDITQKSLLKAANVAVFTMKDKPSTKSSNITHKIAVAASGGVGGFFGLAGLAIELPISTTIMLRSIADIAREQGEPINAIETKLACLEVFALGGKSKSDDGTETGYYAIKAILAKSISETAKFIAEKGIIEEGAPILLKLIAKISERFSIQISEKMISQSVPIIGAAGGALINTMFMDHFQDMAKGHFIMRKIENKYDATYIKTLYEEL